MAEHLITRVRHEIARRRVAVKCVAHLSPGMLRVTLQGGELEGFFSASPDDHIKLFVPGDRAIERRDYTPRRYDPEANTLDLDFALHDAGPATLWAMQAKAGDVVEIAGPRGSTLVPWSFDWYLLAGDETALPAIGRRVEEAPAGVKIISLIAVAGRDEEQVFETRATHSAIWVHRPAARADDPQPMLAALAKIAFPTGDGFVWVAAEAKVAKAVRGYVESERGHPRPWTKASGYWVKGVADAQDKLD
jgi:NADPH-dependent ferric siderophore reductase